MSVRWDIPDSAQRRPARTSPRKARSFLSDLASRGKVRYGGLRFLRGTSGRRVSAALLPLARRPVSSGGWSAGSLSIASSRSPGPSYRRYLDALARVTS